MKIILMLFCTFVMCFSNAQAEEKDLSVSGVFIIPNLSEDTPAASWALWWNLPEQWSYGMETYITKTAVMQSFISKYYFWRHSYLEMGAGRWLHAPEDVNAVKVNLLAGIGIGWLFKGKTELFLETRHYFYGEYAGEYMDAIGVAYHF